MEINELMFELSHADRLIALKLLREDPMRLSKISEALDVTSAEGFRQVERLTRAELIEKKANNHYHITSFGDIALRF